MKGQLLLAEAATTNHDGTISLLRGGITNAWAVKAPIPLQGALVMRFIPEMGDQGRHTFDLLCLGPDGERMLPPIAGQFDAPASGGGANVILGLNMAFPKPGRFVFVLRVDNVQVADLTLTITEQPMPAQPKEPTK